MSRLVRLFFPSGLFAGITMLALFFGIGGHTLHLLADKIVGITAIPGLFLTLRFGFSRQFFTIVMLIALGMGAPLFLPSAVDAMTALSRFYYCLTAVLVPLHCLLFAWWRERGLLNIWGGTRLLWLMFLPILVIFLGTFPDFVRHPVFVDGLCRNIYGKPNLPLAPAAMFVISWMGILYLYGRDTAPNYEGFLWVSVLMAGGFLLRPEVSFFRLAAAAAMIIVLLSIIEAGLFFAYRDELTGLPARRALNNQLQKLGGKYTIAMIDVDHFKRFNDRYGHDVGDEVLKMVAVRLKKSEGKAYRYGGEEFTLIYPGRNADQVAADAEAVREQVAAGGFTIRKPPRKKGENPSLEKRKTGSRQVVAVTVSIGIAERSETFPVPSAVLKAADNALYRAKKNGRNRLETAG